MTNTLQFMQSSHLQAALRDPEIHALNADLLIGRWMNTNRESQGLLEFLVERNDGGFQVRAVAAGADGPIHWPATPAQAMANLEEEGGQRNCVMLATFDFGFMQTQVQIRANNGVLVLVLFTSFHDECGRSNYVCREFFSLERPERE